MTDIVRRGARTSPAQAVDAEVAAHPDGRADLRDEAGR
jgi:hypothetical protein